MNNINLRFDVSTLNNNRKVEKKELKNLRDNLVKLVKDGSASPDSVLDHGVWQICHEIILSNTSENEIKKDELADEISIDPDMYKAIKAYQKNVNVAIHSGLLEEPEGPVRTKSLF